MNSLEAAALGAQSPARQANNPDSTAGSRPEAKAMLLTIIRRIRADADNLEVIYRMLPERPTAEQEVALFRMFSTLER